MVRPGASWSLPTKTSSTISERSLYYYVKPSSLYGLTTQKRSWQRLWLGLFPPLEPPNFSQRAYASKPRKMKKGPIFFMSTVTWTWTKRCFRPCESTRLPKLITKRERGGGILKFSGNLHTAVRPEMKELPF